MASNINSAKNPPSSNNNFPNKTGNGIRKSQISGVPKLPKVAISNSNVSSNGVKKGDVISGMIGTMGAIGTIGSIGSAATIGN